MLLAGTLQLCDLSPSLFLHTNFLSRIVLSVFPDFFLLYHFHSEFYLKWFVLSLLSSDSHFLAHTRSSASLRAARWNNLPHAVLLQMIEV